MGKLGKIAKKGGELAGVVKKTDKAAEGITANKASGKGKGGRVDGGPCDHLKQGSGKGPYRGGAHSKTSKPKNDGKDSHHIPSDAASPLSKKDGPKDSDASERSRKTSSNGQTPGYEDYIDSIGELIKQGRWRDAFAKEVKDVRRVAREIEDPKIQRSASRNALSILNALKNGLLK